ncbi:MAG: glycosyltransferase [Terriglobia bacterium]
MTVCFISHTSGDGGAERVLLEAVEVLRERGIRCLVVFPNHGPLAESVRARGVPCRVIPFRWWVGGDSFWKRIAKLPLHIFAALRLSLYLARNPCDLIVTNTITPVVGSLAGLLMRLPHIWWIHEFAKEDKEDYGLDFDFGFRFSARFMGWTSDTVLVVSNAVQRKYARHISDKKLRVLYPSVHLGFAELSMEPGQQSLQAAVFRVCAVGSIQPGKGQEDAVRAIGILRKRGTNATLLVLGSSGDGAYLERIRRIAAEWGVEQYIHFAGHVANPLALILPCDVVAVCSRSEGFGRVTVEAMKLGEPVVGADARGTAELIREGFNGFLYSPGDHTALAAKLEYLFEHPEVRQSVGENARSWAWQQFTVERFSEDILRVFVAAAYPLKRHRNASQAERRRGQ